MAGDWDDAVAQAAGNAPGAKAGDWEQHVEAVAPGGPQITNPLIRYPLKVGADIAAGVAGLADMPRTIAGALDYPLTLGANLLTGNNFESPAAAADKRFHIPAAADAANALGVNSPRIAARNVPEALFDAAVRGAPAAGLDILTGGAMTPALVGNMTASTAGEAAHQAFPESRLLPILAGMAGGLGVSKWFQGRNAEKAFQALEKDQAAAADHSLQAQAAMKAARDAKQTAQWDAKDLADSNISKSRADADAFIQQANLERRAALQAQEEATEGVAAALGNSKTVEDAGMQLQNSARNWVAKDLPKKISDLWATVDKMIPAEAQVDLQATRRALQKINTKAGEAQPLIEAVKPTGAPNRLLARLQSLDEAKALVGGTGPKTFNWRDAQTLRSEIGDFMADPQVIREIGQKNLSKLYATLTADLKAAAGKVSPEAGAAFDMANAGSKSLYSKAESTFGRLVTGAKANASDPLPGATAASLLRRGANDSTELQVLRDEVPDAADHLAAVAIRSGQWSRLSSESQAALIPDAAKRAEVTYGLKVREDINKAADDAVAAAKKNHERNSQLARQDQQNANRSSAKAFMSARTASEAAAEKAKELAQQYQEELKRRAAQAKTGGIANNVRDAWHGIASGAGAYGMLHFGQEALKHFGVTVDNPKPLALGFGLLGYGVPKVARGVTNVLTDVATNPASTRATTLGAAAGSSWIPQDQQIRQNPFGARGQ